MEGGEEARGECGQGCETIKMQRALVFTFIITSLLFFCFPPVSYSADKTKEEVAEQEPPTEETPEEVDKYQRGLDWHYRSSRKLIGELDAYGGWYLGDLSKSSWGVGGRTYLHINHIVAVGASYAYSPLVVDSTSEFGASVTNKNQHLINAEVMLTNQAAMMAGDHVIPLDFYFTVGQGAIWINNHWKWMTVIGGGLKIYTGPEWLALRFDVNSYIHPVPKPSGSSIGADVSFWVGAAFHFPNKKAEMRDES